MTWSYLPQLLLDDDVDPQQRNLMRLRLELADTDTTEQLLQDEEIFYCLAVESSLDQSAARGAEWISRIFSRQADTIQNPTVKLSFRQREQRYAELATALRKRASGSHAPIFGGGSRAAKQSQQQNTDRSGPYFRKGMMDRLSSDDAGSAFATGLDPLFVNGG